MNEVMHIHLLPVFSKYASPDLLARVLRGRSLPEHIHLSEHQALTLEALEDPDVQIVLNTAMTGDGKSLAGYLPALLPGADQASTLALYPTNELSKDQTRQFERYKETFGARLRYDTLWGDRLTELAHPGRDGRAHALLDLLKHRDVLLTNPDIFIRMLSYQYHSSVFTRQEIPYSVLTNFTLLLFDEFHLFSMPQFAAAAAALVYAQEHDPNHSPKALFSSATQHPSLLHLIKRAGLRTREVPGVYASAGADPASLTEAYRQILHPTDLHLHQLTGDQTIESWMHEHLDLLIAVWQDGRSARVAIIVSSIAIAHRIAQWLKAELAAHPGKPGGWSVEEVTGLSHGSLDADIVVGTSTIDVGIDFDINLLIFEALNAGQFLQRLGRLGRYHQDKASFANYTAHALISAKTPWVSARMIEAFKEAGTEDGSPVDRPNTLRAAVEASYPNEADFAPYVRRWAALQGYHIINSMRDQRDSRKEESPYAPIADPLELRYAQLYGLNTMRSLAGRYFRLSKLSGKTGHLQLEEILSFRGSSPFQVCLWDPTRSSSRDQFQTYDLLSLLKTTEWSFVPYQGFLERLRAACASQEEFTERQREFVWTLRDKNEQPLCLHVNSYLEERERLVLSQEEDLDDLGVLDQAVVLKHFRVAEPRTRALGEVNDILHRRTVVCYVTRVPAADLFRRYRLPALFPLYSLSVTHVRERCTVAFGKSALMLEALIRSRRRPQSDQSPIIC